MVAAKLVEGAMCVLYCLMVSGIVLYLQECYKSGMVFRRWYVLLTYYWIKNWRKSDRWKRKILKPLGLCVWCQLFWLHLIVYLMTFTFDFFKFVMLLSITYLITKIIYVNTEQKG